MINNPVYLNHEKIFLKFFSKTSNLNYNPEFIKIIQTHISIICVAPPFVFKVKKDIKLDFLDYSSMEKRKQYLYKEFQLNKRLCNDIYLDVLPVYLKGKTLTYNKTDQLYDHVLKMKYVNDDYNMAYLLNHGLLKSSHIKKLASYLITFYRNQKPVSKGKSTISRQLSVIKKNIIETIAENESASAAVSLDTIKYYTNLFISVKKDQFRQRYIDGYTRDCHGDLRIEHIFFQQDKICIYDCIEFNDSFRVIDLLCDIAFLAMELDFSGYHDISLNLLQNLDKQSGLTFDLPLLCFYKTYRAMVRAKVNFILSGEPEINLPARKSALSKAGQFISLSLKYSLSNDLPLLVIIMGKTASGKSTISKLVSEALNAPRFSTDETRKTMANIDLYKQTPEKLKQEIYSSKFSSMVYKKIILSAKEALAKTNVAVMDGTFSKKVYRTEILNTFKTARVVFIELQSASSLVKSRLENRSFEKTVSDARINDKVLIDSLYEPPDELTSYQKITVKNNKSPDLTLRSVFKRLAWLNINSDSLKNEIFKT